jgi:hypothetical protein
MLVFSAHKTIDNVGSFVYFWRAVELTEVVVEDSHVRVEETELWTTKV